MRRLSREELVSETCHRLTIRRTHATGLHRELVELIAEMIELADEPVPDCYTQATATPPTRPLRACPTCGGGGYVMSGLACPDCQGRT